MTRLAVPVKGIDGQPVNPISAVCTDGRARFRIAANFEDGTKTEAEIIRACSTKG
jgi:hypothetical protein